MNRRTTTLGAVALGLSVFLAVPAAQAKQPGTAPTTPAATATIHVPSGFDKTLGDTRINGHYAVVGTGLHIWTDGSTDVDPATALNSDKVAEYVDTKTPLASVDNPTLDYTVTDATAAPGAPGYQLVVDLDGNGTPDGILVGEPAFYGNDWWLAGASPTFDWSTAPGAADGYDHSAPLTDWNAAFPTARVMAFGFSLGSGIHGDGTLNAINFAGTSYTFAADVVLTSKDECKSGGWATSTAPVYRNQGECVSHFATASNNGKGSGSSTGTVVPTAPAVTPAVVPALHAGKIRAI